MRSSSHSIRSSISSAPSLEAIARFWRDYADAAEKVRPNEFEKTRANFLRNLVCLSGENGNAIFDGLFRNWLAFRAHETPDFAKTFAQGIMRQDGPECEARQYLDRRTVGHLRNMTSGREPPDAPAAGRE